MVYSKSLKKFGKVTGIGGKHGVYGFSVVVRFSDDSQHFFTKEGMLGLVEGEEVDLVVAPSVGDMVKVHVLGNVVSHVVATDYSSIYCICVDLKQDWWLKFDEVTLVDSEPKEAVEEPKYTNIAKLVAKHTVVAQNASHDPSFEEAAEDLAEEIAGKLLSEDLVRRRMQHSWEVFRAAFEILQKAGASVDMLNDAIWVKKC
jgi:hypothetical protein